MNVTTLKFDTVGSTNTEAMDQARLGAPEGLCVVARQQTNGRGRHGRVWVSPPDAGLYLSIVLRPKLEMQYIPLITLAGGIAVYETLADLGIKADIKWVNDVLIAARKVAGILGETTDTPSGLAVVLGFGLNVANSSFPPVIADKATALSHHLDHVVRPAELVEPLIANFCRLYERLQTPDGPPSVVTEWGRRSSYFKGRAVKVIIEGGIVRGVTDGLEPSGALRIVTEEGSTRIIQAGHVELLRADAA